MRKLRGKQVKVLHGPATVNEKPISMANHKPGDLHKDNPSTAEYRNGEGDKVIRAVEFPGLFFVGKTRKFLYKSMSP